MNTFITPFIFLMVLISLFLFGMSLENGTESQRLAWRKMLLCAVVGAFLYLLVSFGISAIPMKLEERMFLVPIVPILFFIALFYCNFRIYRRSLRDPSVIGFIIACGILFTCMVSMGVNHYHVVANFPRNPQEMPNLPERLPPLVPSTR